MASNLLNAILGLVLTTICAHGTPLKSEQELQKLNNIETAIDSHGIEYSETLYIPFWPSSEILARLGQVSGIDVGPENNIYVFHRGDRVWEVSDFDSNNIFVAKDKGPIQESTILVFPNNLEDGQITHHFGSELFYLPHGLTVDHEGNVWVTDVALHQVMKFPRGQTRPSLVLGEAFVPGSDSKHFCKPTHVAVAKNGDFFVADGYCNARIMKFNSKGELLHQWGKHDNGDNALTGEELNLPHHLALLEDKDEICVADRQHQRVVCFNAGLKNPKNTGEFAFEIKEKLFGDVYAIAYNSKFNTMYVMGWGSSEVARSELFVYDLKKKEIIDRVVYPSKQGFGGGHAVASCSDGTCLAVGGLDKVCPSEVEAMCNPNVVPENMALQSRNVWLYGVLDVTEEREMARQIEKEM